ncbi:hypothetical protein DFP72DRAFT_1075116 [Ephemerocybe angulata]|uniref:Uncharacterized protein n=1 Tax=Ephemerocybe angulata TaxID=980116 RepID=A0A8H6HJT4_9AGAR|nr:hypothetical protein DFP72DRAFT_1075116 [Tulosesus angulatus]
MSFQPTSSSLFDMTRGSDKYNECLESCRKHEATRVNDRDHYVKVKEQRLLAEPCVLPVENHGIDGGLCNDLVFCIVCDAGVKLHSNRPRTRTFWDQHTRTEKHRTNVAKWEALHGPLERVEKSTMPRYSAVWEDCVFGQARLVPKVYVPHQGDMFSEHNDLIPITLA